MSVTHELKTWPQYFDAVDRGEKTFEVRRDDRGFQRGDVVRLVRFDPAEGEWRYRHFREVLPTITKRITYVLTGGQFGIEPGYVVLGLGDNAKATSEGVG